MSKRKTGKSVFVDVGEGNNSHRVTSDEVELPELENNSLLVQVRACGLAGRQYNTGALCQLLQKVSKTKRLGVGQDIAGIVVEVGVEVTAFAKGDHVVGIVPLDYNQSGCSDFVVVKEFDTVLKPDNVSFVDAAGCIGDAVKAYTALHYLGRLEFADTVLILHGASSFGSISIQLARHWGARVLTTSSSDDEKRYLQSLELELTQIIELNHKNASLKSAVMLETGNVGVAIVVDQGVSQFPQGNVTYGENKLNEANALPSKHDIISCLSVGGRWITSEANLQLDPPNSRLLFFRCASLGFLFEQSWILSGAQQGRYQHILMDIVEKVSARVIRPNIHHTVSFDGVLEIVKASEDLRVGKVVMTE